MQARTLNWQNEEKNLAPLTETQLDIIYEISSYINKEYYHKSVSND